MAYTTHANGDFLTRSGSYNVTKKILDGVITLSRYIDCSVDNLASGAYYKIFSVPDNFCLIDAYVSCDVAEGAADTIDIVDDDSATTTIVSNANVNSAGTITITNARKTYQAAGFIVMKPDAALTVAKFWVIIRGFVLNTSM